MIDRVTDYQRGESASAIKNVTLSENILHDHFPDYPVLPGALVIEAMAQLGGFLVEMSLNKPDLVRRALLAQIRSAKFHKPAEPGDQLLLHAKMEGRMDDAVNVAVRVNLLNKKMASANLMFVLQEVESEKIHRQRRYLYKLWTKRLHPTPGIL
ncbi:MAG: beta-hydroxyacyl-ACP dehydratase [Desulfobacterales bacterium]|nr:beta-hydroxyacyl-ACP dehydratase [Desulfobacterales bacterium]